MYTIIATLKSQPGKEAELAKVCAELGKEVRAKEAGCLMYIPHITKKDPAEIVFFEKYKDLESFQAHGETPYYQAAARKFKDLAAGPPEVKVLLEL